MHKKLLFPKLPFKTLALWPHSHNPKMCPVPCLQCRVFEVVYKGVPSTLLLLLLALLPVCNPEGSAPHYKIHLIQNIGLLKTCVPFADWKRDEVSLSSQCIRKPESSRQDLQTPKTRPCNQQNNYQWLNTNTAAVLPRQNCLNIGYSFFTMIGLVYKRKAHFKRSFFIRKQKCYGNASCLKWRLIYTVDWCSQNHFRNLPVLIRARHLAGMCLRNPGIF